MLRLQRYTNSRKILGMRSALRRTLHPKEPPRYTFSSVKLVQNYSRDSVTVSIIFINALVIENIEKAKHVSSIFSQLNLTGNLQTDFKQFNHFLCKIT